MKTISNEDRVRIFANNIGCNVITKEGLQGILVGIFATHNSCNIELPDGSISVGHLISDCQLLLKELPEISDRDMVEVGRLYYNQVIRSDAFHLREGKQLLHNFSLGGNLTVCIIDYIRSKSYNIGYGRYTPSDLIEAGIVKVKTGNV